MSDAITPCPGCATENQTTARTSRYLGCRVAFLTQHGKEKIVAPELEPALGCRVAHVSGFDTDQLGTFTRNIPRAGIQLEAARKKACLGMELAGLPLGIASGHFYLGESGHYYLGLTRN